jgi:putative heme-binding domain-containing protein
MNLKKPLPPDLKPSVLNRLGDPAPEVREAAILAVVAYRMFEAVPRLIVLAGKTGSPDRSAAILALCRLPDPRAFSIYLAAIRDPSPQLRRAGESALLSIRDRVSDALKSAARSAPSSSPEALSLERVLARFEPIRTWRVIGPFPRAIPQVFVGDPAIDFARAHAGAEGKAIGWKVLRSDPNTGRVDLDDLKRASGVREGLGYETTDSADLSAFGFAEVDSDAEGPALMLLGSSGALLVTVNEKLVFESTSRAGREYAADTELVRFPMARGRNRILVVSRQGIGRWGFGVQFARSPLATSLEVARPAVAKVDDLRRVALRHDGDPRRGEAIFFDPKGVGCVRCHSAGGRGTSTIGPDLTGLALKYDRAELIRSVLEPSSRIATGYQPAIVATRDGKVLTGVVRAETGDWLELADSEAKVTRVAKPDITERRLGDVSIMPVQMVESLSPAEFADLISFLASLKTPVSPH